jgi:hypothetical protein
LVTNSRGRPAGARLRPLFSCLLALAGCRGCVGLHAGQVHGDTPYVRCLAGAPPSSGTRKVGRLTLRLQERVLRVEGLRRPLTLAAFAGPGLGAAPAGAELAALRAAGPDLLLLLGDVGDRPATARATLAQLATLAAPTLVVAGGRDTPGRIADALDAVPAGNRMRIIDTTAIREIRLGSDTLVPVAGSLDGHYALEDAACGYGLDDLKHLAGELASGRARRWLLAWEAPGLGGPRGVARTDQGVDVGSPALAQLSLRIGAPGGIFAWPRVQLGRPAIRKGAQRVAPGTAAADLQVVVPRLSGPAAERGDRSTVRPGFALLQLDPSGLSLRELHAIDGP